ncbi:MAG: hypothetical protein MJ200_05170 [Mycoplasmoidaceae bacterium]|nr:hypothetical protein [Mycoplasmoidaceae bacterium]
MDLVQPFTEASIKTGTTGVAEDGQNFKVEVYSDKEKTEKDCLQYATYRLIGAPE